MWKRASRDDANHLSEERKALAARYTIDEDEARRREQLAPKAAAREASEPPDRAALNELDETIEQLARQYERGSVEPAGSEQPRLTARPEPPEASKVTAGLQQPVIYPLALFSVRPRQLLLLGFTAVAAACYATNWQSPVRVAVMVVFFLFVPGLALAELAPLADRPERLVVGIGASLALETLVAVAFLYAGFFTPDRVIAVFLLTTAGLTAVAALRTPQAS